MRQAVVYVGGWGVEVQAKPRHCICLQTVRCRAMAVPYHYWCTPAPYQRSPPVPMAPCPGSATTPTTDRINFESTSVGPYRLAIIIPVTDVMTDRRTDFEIARLALQCLVLCHPYESPAPTPLAECTVY